MSKKRALIMVDLQNDFCAGGSLAVPDADAIIPLANQIQQYFDLVIATKDWHPLEHMSFATNHPGYAVGDSIVVDQMDQILWPNHCVQGSNGADFHPKLQTEKIVQIFHKGTDKNIDSYSAFFDNAHMRSTGLADYLRSKDIEDIYIMGLATDYCVKYSSLDAIKLGFNVYIITDACRGVELKTGDVARTLKELKTVGVKLIESNDVLTR